MTIAQNGAFLQTILLGILAACTKRAFGTRVSWYRIHQKVALPQPCPKGQEPIKRLGVVLSTNVGDTEPR